MSTQPQASQPKKSSLPDPIQECIRLTWKVLTLVLGPFYPFVITPVEKLWAALLTPLYTQIAKTKLLDSVQWTIVGGLVTLGILLLIIRIIVNV